MGLMKKLDTWAIKRMTKENFIASWKMGAGCPGGRPPANAIAAIERVAEVASENVNPYDTDAAAIRLLDPLQAFARSLNMDPLQIAVGSGVLIGIFSQFSGYKWAADCVMTWEVCSMYKHL